MAHDVFISYSSKDTPIANAVCAYLEDRTCRCWIAPRDVLPGLPYAEAIVDAIEASRVIVLVFSVSANDSPQVMREVERAVSRGLPIIPLRIELVQPTRSLEYFISASHGLDAFTPPLQDHLHKLGETVESLLTRAGYRGAGRHGELPAALTRIDERNSGRPVRKRRLLSLVNGVILLGLLCAAIGAAVVLSRGGIEAGRRNEEPVTGIDPHSEKTPRPDRPVLLTNGPESPPSTQKADPPTPNNAVPRESYVNSVEMHFAWINPGDFFMGGGDDDAKPVRQVRITRGFYMGVYPVTQGEWKKVMDDNNPSSFKADDLPVEMVSWDDCKKFCDELSRRDGRPYRLPTEAEWEYACRAGTTTEYYTGDGEESLKAAGWFLSNSGKRTQPVGKLRKNAWGLYDMHGNVFQWCQDRYGPYLENDTTNPKGPETGEFRVARGGCWLFSAANCRVYHRLRVRQADGFNVTGFRVCFFPD